FYRGFLIIKNMPRTSLSVMRLFGSSGSVVANNYEQIFIDAATPSNSISSRKARHIIRQLVQGLRIAGLERGDCVCVHSFNDVSMLLFLRAQRSMLLRDHVIADRNRYTIRCCFLESLRLEGYLQ